MSTKHYPSAEYLRQCLKYQDGKLYWLRRPRHHFNTELHWKAWNTRWAGKEAGRLSGNKSKPRCYVGLDGVPFARYHFVWAMHGRGWPKYLDHKDQDQLNDRIENLRVATNSQNLANASVQGNNQSGFKGVSWDQARSRWRAQIRVNYGNIFLGRFSDPAEAHAAYVEAAKKHFGEFACSG